MILLYIRNKKKYPREFVDRLQSKQVIFNRFKLLVNIDRLLSIQEPLRILYNDPTLDILKICETGIKNSIIIEAGNDDYEIIVNPDLKINNHNVDSIFKLINDGNLGIKESPYKIFTLLNNVIQKELPSLIQLDSIGALL